MPAPRYAIAYTPPPDSPLARFGAAVLGYDCYDGIEVPRRTIDGIDPTILRLITVERRRFGLHAPLMAPFCLAGAQDDLVAAAGRFAHGCRTIPVGPLAIAAVGRFVVLRPVEPPLHIEEFAADCLHAFEAFRDRSAPAHQQYENLTPRQTELLDRWGDPYVLDEFRFQMALAGPIPESEQDPIAQAFTTAFAPMARDPLELDAISLLRRRNGNGRLQVVERWRLTGRR